MAKKTPSANIKITSALNTVLTNPSGIVSNNSVLNTSGLSSSIKVTGGVFGAPARALSPIHHVDIQDITGIFRTLFFNDSATILDLTAIDISKPFTDSSPAIDFKSIQFTKGASDSATASDAATIITQYSPIYFDAVSEFDAISFNTNKVLADTQDGQTDAITFNTNKVLTDTQDGQTDSTSLSFIKVLSDFVTTIDLAEVFDGSTYTLSKSLFDSISQSDSIAFATNKVLADTESPTDLYTTQFTKVLADIQEGQIDNAIVIMGFNRSFADSQSASDAIQSFNFNKVLTDTATALDLLEVFDGSTYSFVKSLADIQGQIDELSRIVDYNRTLTDTQDGQTDLAALSVTKVLADTQNGQTDSLVLSTIKSLADIQGQIDELSRIVDYNRIFSHEAFSTDDIQSFDFNKVLADTESPTDAIQSFNFNKVLADAAVVEDLAGIFDGSLYQFIKVIQDVNTIDDSLSRTVDYNRSFIDAQTSEDRPYKEFNKAGIADRTRNWFAEGPAFHPSDEYAEDYFEITFDPIGGWPEEYAIIMGPTIDFNKAVNELITTSDIFSYVSQFIRTFNDTPIVTESPAININKILAPDFAGQNEGPSFQDAADYAPSYFADDYTELYGPIISFIKSLTDSVSTSDIFARSVTFLRSLSETLVASDANVIDYTFAKSDSVTILDDDITTINFNKVFADSVTTIDLIDIFDGSTYTLDKSFSEIITILNVPTITFQKGTIAETLTASDDDTVQFIKAPSDSVDGNDNGLPIDEEYYSINYFPDTYIDDFKAGVIITFAKSIADFVTILDDATPALDGFNLDPAFASAFDETIYSFIKVLTETQPAVDDSVIQFVKPLSDVTPPVEGPSFSDADGYASGWIASLYTIKRRPVINFAKALATISNPVADASSFVFSRGVESDSVTITDDISTFNFIKALADTATALDLLEVFDGSTYSFVKSLADTQPASESKAIDFTKILPGLITYPLVVSSVALRVDSESIYVDANLISQSTSTDPAYALDAPAIQLTKILADSVTTLDLIDIFDGSLYTLNKVFADTQSITDDIEQFTFNKVLADTAVTLDNIDIFDGSTYSISKVLETLSEVPVDDISFNNTLVKADTQSLSDDDTIQFIKVLADTQDQQIGPAFYEEADYAADYFDPTDGIMYTVLGRPIFDFIKALQDTQNQTDFTVFNLNKPLSDTQLGQEDNDTIQFTKARQDTVEPTDDISTFDFIKALADTATTLDNIDIFDGSTYTIAKALQDTQNIAENKAITLIKGPSSFTDTQSLSDDDTVQFTKARSDSVSGNDNGTAIDEEYYSINYFPDTYIDDFLSGVAKSFIKALADIVTVLDEATAGLVNFPLEPQSVSLTDVNIYSFIKSLSETSVITENASITFSRPLSDTAQHFEGPGFGNSNDYASEWVNTLYTIKRRLIYSLIKPLTETLTAPDASSFTFSRGIEAETLVASDVYESHYQFAKSETITVSEDIQQFTIIKPLSDSVEAVDLAGIFDGSLYSIILSKNETLVASDVYISTLFKPFTETITISDDGDLSVYTLLKPFTETLVAPIGPAFYGTEEYAASYFDGADYTELGRPIFDITKPLPNDNITALSRPYITIIKGSSSFTDTQSLSDSDTIQFIKRRSDSVLGSDNGIAVDEEYYAINYFPDTYIDDFLSGVQKTFTKSLADSVTVLDEATAGITGFPMDPETISLTDTNIYSFIKALSETPTIAENAAITLSKILPNDIAQSVEGPSFSDADGYANDWIASLYTIKRRPTINFTKVVADTISTPEFFGWVFQPGTIAEILTASDAYISTLVKPFTETITSTDDITQYTLNKVLADSVEAVDLAGIFDGSLYSIILSKNETLTVSDVYISTFTKPFTETITVTEDGDQFTYSIFKPFTENKRALEGPGYHGTEEYAINYFDDADYTELYNPAINFTKVLSITQLGQTDNFTHQTTKALADSVSPTDDITAFGFIKAPSDSQSVTDDITEYTFNKVLADTATPEDLLGVFDGSTFSINSVLTTASNPVTEDLSYSINKPLSDTQLGQTDAKAISFTKSRSDTVTITDDITQYTINKALNDTPTPSDDIQQFTVSKVLADTATPLDLVGISDGSTYTFNKTLADVTGTPTDSLSRTISFVRGLTETITTSAGTPVFNLNLAFEDTVTADDFFDYDSTAPTLLTPSDTPSADDSGSLRMSDYFEDLSYFEGVYIGTERTFT
jgi:hypothetical protein